jgi:hypothetical protein
MRVKRGGVGPRPPGVTSLSSRAGTDVGQRRRPTQFDDQRPGWDFTCGDVGKLKLTEDQVKVSRMRITENTRGVAFARVRLPPRPSRVTVPLASSSIFEFARLFRTVSSAPTRFLGAARRRSRVSHPKTARACPDTPRAHRTHHTRPVPNPFAIFTRRAALCTRRSTSRRRRKSSPGEARRRRSGFDRDRAIHTKWWWIRSISKESTMRLQTHRVRFPRALRPGSEEARTVRAPG